MAGDPTAVMNRYRDAYRVANTIVAIGNTIKILGIVVWILLILGLLYLGSRGSSGFLQQESSLAIALIAGVIGGAPVALLFWLLGILVNSQGQILLASLDEAVNTSPFLTNEQKAEAMSLPRTVVPSASEAENPTGTRRTCTACGKANEPDESFCVHCGTALA